MDENTLTSPTGDSPFGLRSSLFLASLVFFSFLYHLALRSWAFPLFSTLCYTGHVTILTTVTHFFFFVYPNYYLSPLRLSQLILPIAVEGVAIMENAFLRTPAESLEHFKVSEQTGLSQNAVVRSRQQYGPNG